MTAADFLTYLLIYNHNIEIWWDAWTAFYYTPLFYVLFWPFKFLGYQYFFGCQVVALISIEVIAIWKKRWDIVIIFTWWIILDIEVGNIDIFVSLLVILMRFGYIKRKWHGLIIGILLFKPSVVLLVPLFALDGDIFDKKYWIGIGFGFLMNFGLFLFRFDLMDNFLIQILCTNHPWGILYMLCIQYPWFWWTLITISDGDLQYSQKMGFLQSLHMRYLNLKEKIFLSLYQIFRRNQKNNLLFLLTDKKITNLRRINI